MGRLYDRVPDINELGAKKPGFQIVMYRYKRWPDNQIVRHDVYLKDRFPDCDTFFTSSMAAQAGLCERTLRNYLKTNPTLGFVRRLESGEMGTHSDSMRGRGQCRSRNDGKKRVTTWQDNFVRELHVTDVDAGSAVTVGKADEKK